MDKKKVIYQIGDLIEQHCRGCTINPFPSENPSTYSKRDGWCNKHCNIGKQLQELGGKMTNNDPVRQTIILADLDFGFDPFQLKDITNYWEDGKEVEDIAKIFKRDPDEIFLALFHQSREGLIERPFARRML